jgi:hypothetical protein
VKSDKPSLAHGDPEVRARFVRRLVLAELLARPGEGPLAPRFPLLPARRPAFQAGEPGEREP